MHACIYGNRYGRFEHGRPGDYERVELEVRVRGLRQAPLVRVLSLLVSDALITVTHILFTSMVTSFMVALSRFRLRASSADSDLCPLALGAARRRVGCCCALLFGEDVCGG